MKVLNEEYKTEGNQWESKVEALPKLWDKLKSFYGALRCEDERSVSLKSYIYYREQ